MNKILWSLFFLSPCFSVSHSKASPRAVCNLIKVNTQRAFRHLSTKASGIEELCGVSQFQNRRPYQEDRCFLGHIKPGILYAGVCDGHGGDAVADSAAYLFPKQLQSLWGAYNEVEPSLLEAVANTEEQLLENHQEVNKGICGSTLSSAIITPSKVHLVQLGDSAIIGLVGDECTSLVTEHKPDAEEEKERIEGAGGEVIDAFGANRLMGTLAVSRALGNFALKHYGLSAIPQIISIPRTKDFKALVIASDGLTEGLSLDEVQEILYTCSNAKQAAEKLTMSAADRSEDNISTIVIPLFKFPSEL